MRAPSRTGRAAFAAVGLAALATAAAILPACGMQKKSAETGIASLEAAYAPVRQQATSVAPEQAGHLEEAIAAARADIDRGNYDAARRATAELRTRLKELTDRLPAMQSELESAWKDVSASLPGTLAALERKLGRANRPAGSARRAAFDAATSELRSITAAWQDAQAAMRGGRLAEAVNGAENARDRALRVLAGSKDGS